MDLVEKTENSRILIIGGTGSLGQMLMSRFLELDRRNEVLIVSRDEAKQWTIKNEMNKRTDLNVKNLTFAVGDIRDEERMFRIINSYKPSHIIMAAALKQVDTCEVAPEESVKTNLLGIQSVLDAVDRSPTKEEWLKCVLLVSTDKACEPINVYGMCKAISERLVTSRNSENTTVKYVAVRYGNVLNSRGSILPLFKWQAENADYFTVTHKDMTRFIMTLDQSVNLIENAMGLLSSGRIMVPKLKSMKIEDLANIFSRRYNKPVKFVGMRPGEKMHEIMIGESESYRTVSSHDNFVIFPSTSTVMQSQKSFEFSSGDSKNLMTEAELEKYLDSIGILKMRMDQFFGKRIDDIVSPTEKK